jgi:hypothetical protein
MKITAMREARKRLGIPESKPLDRDFVPMLIDREGGWVDGNWTVVSSMFVNWAIEQPELLVPGALEYFQVIANSHITGVVGGVGSPRHKHAMIAWQRFTSFTSSEAAAIKAAKIVVDRWNAKWPSSRLGVVEPALSPKEYSKRISENGAHFADAPHLCPKCMTGYGCESVPCAASFESICKSCDGEVSGCQQHDGGQRRSGIRVAKRA